MSSKTTSYQYQANTGLATISVANNNIDGTGTLVRVIVGASAITQSSQGGTVIRSVTIKATQSTSQGMVRLFLFDGTNYALLKEIIIPATTVTATLPAFCACVPLFCTLNPGIELLASTANSETFNIIADALNYGNCGCSTTTPNGSPIQYTSNTGFNLLSTANSNLDGSGAVNLIYTSDAINQGGIAGGSRVRMIEVKGAQSITSQNMIRLFISDGNNLYLMSELQIQPSDSISGELATICYNLPANLHLQTGYSIYASTENSENFNVIISGMDYECCSC